jgi:hypothetical protein
MRLISVGLLVMSFVAKLNASGRMEVSICNLGNLPEYLVGGAETEASFVFRSMDVEVVWLGCVSLSEGDRAAGTPRFIIRLRSDFTPSTAGSLSLHAMGLAFVSPGGEGYLADVYYPAIQALSMRSQAEESWLIGCTMAHEIGHLLLGPGHRLGSIMSARWGERETLAIAQRSLGFDRADRLRIQSRLEVQGRPRP